MKKMLQQSVQRPAWLSNSLKSYENRYVTKRYMRFCEKDYFVKGHGFQFAFDGRNFENR